MIRLICFEMFFLIIGRDIIKNKVKFAIVLLQETNKTMKDNNKSSVFLLLCLFTTRNLQFDTHDLRKVSKHILKQQRATFLQML